MRASVVCAQVRALDPRAPAAGEARDQCAVADRCLRAGQRAGNYGPARVGLVCVVALPEGSVIASGSVTSAAERLARGP